MNSNGTSKRDISRFKDESALGLRSDLGKKAKIVIEDRYVLKTLLFSNPAFKIYKGVDIEEKKFVIVYVKPSAKEKSFSRKIKEELKQKVSPPVKTVFTTEIQKHPFDIEIHMKYGPSLENILTVYKNKIAPKTLFLLTYQMIKLISRVDNAGYVARDLHPRIILCHHQPQKTELFLLNCFDLERKNDECPSLKSKYCSVGAHLGLRLETCSKDTLESMCYVLMDLYLQGKLFTNFHKDYETAKTLLKPEKIPTTFLNFFYYVKNLNQQEQAKFNEWKSVFKRQLKEEEFGKPYEWIQQKMNQSSLLKEQKQKQISETDSKILNSEIQEQQKQEQQEIDKISDPGELDEFGENENDKLTSTMRKFIFGGLVHSKHEQNS